jgi:hypothetical protein
MIIETKIQRNYGTDHEYIVEPLNFATLWSDITGRKTVTDADLSNIKALAHFFESGLAITRNK